MVVIYAAGQVFSGRTLLLDALLITLGPAGRNNIYEALIGNVNNILQEEGVVVHIT